MVADALEATSPYENVHDKVIIDATSIPSADPRSGEAPLLVPSSKRRPIGGEEKRSRQLGR